MQVTVAVLGDLGRSPRMRYHALALAARDVDVDVIGYGGNLPPEFVAAPRIRCHLLRDRDRRDREASRWRFVAGGGWRVARQATQLLCALLFRVRRPDVLLVQTPPAVPTLLAALMAARLRGARLIVDWHNFSWSLLALPLGPGQPIVRLMEMHERIVGRRADAHLCVSAAMQRWLLDRWQIPATVLYDRPAEVFGAEAPADREEAARRLCSEFGFNERQRPALVVAPLGWTADDDLDLLVDALAALERLIVGMERNRAAPFTPLLLLLTGDGPRHERYSRMLAERTERRVFVRTAWLSADAYGDALASADLGLSLHRSASGVDLPMKLADMFGAGLPVCALDYGPTLRELVSEGENALLFTDASGLAHALVRVFEDFPAYVPLRALRAGASASAVVRWQQGWLQEAWPVVRGAQGTAA